MGITSKSVDYRLYITSARSLQASCGPKIFFALPKKHLTNANFRRILRGKLKPLMQTSKQTGFLPESCRVVRVQQKDVCRMDCGGQAEREGK